MNEKLKAWSSIVVLCIIGIAGWFGVAVDENIVTSIVGLAFIVFSIIYAAYKNHNFTTFSGAIQAILNEMKDNNEEIISDVYEIVDKIKVCDRGEDCDRSGE